MGGDMGGRESRGSCVGNVRLATLCQQQGGASGGLIDQLVVAPLAAIVADADRDGAKDGPSLVLSEVRPRSMVSLYGVNALGLQQSDFLGIARGRPNRLSRGHPLSREHASQKAATEDKVMIHKVPYRSLQETAVAIYYVP